MDFAFGLTMCVILKRALGKGFTGSQIIYIFDGDFVYMDEPMRKAILR